MQNPHAVVIGGNGLTYVADTFNKRIQIFGSGPTPTLRESWGQVKARYHAAPGMTVTPGADNR
jgi:hypothetical protein